MRIERLEIAGFGRLQGRRLDLGPGFTVLYGHNEAGKTTLLQFIRAMLFGIPGRSYPSERLEPMSGGSHGGVLVALDEEGEQWTIRRYAGGEGGRGERLTVTLRGEDGSVTEMKPSDLEQRLLGGVSKAMFRQLFAITLDELQELGSLQSDELGGYLFHAGIAGGADILGAERKFQQEADKLYKPRGRTQEAAKVIQSIEQLDRLLADSRSLLPRYNRNTAALHAAEARLGELEKRKLAEGESLKLLRQALEIRGLWLKGEAAKQELRELPALPSFPEDAAGRWRELQTRAEQAVLAAERAKRNVLALQTELEAIPSDPLLEAQGPLLERLFRSLAGYENRLAEAQRLRGELDSLRGQLRHTLQAIHPGWSRTDLAGFSGAAADREAARKYAASFAAYDRRMESLAAERQTLRQQLAGAQAALQQAERSLARSREEGAAAFAALRPLSPRETARLWDELQEAAERWRESGLQPGSRRTGPARAGAGPLLPLAAALTVLLPAALMLTGSPPASVVIALGLLAAADLALLAGARIARRQASPPGATGGEEAAAEMHRLRGLLLSGPEAESLSLRPARRPQSRQPGPEAAGLEAGMKELRRLMDAWSEWRQRMERHESERENRRLEAESLAGRERALAAGMEAAEEEFRQLSERFEDWLRRRHLPEDLSPEGLNDIFALAQQGNDQLLREEELLRQLESIDRETAAFEEQCLDLLKEAGSGDAAAARENPPAALPPGSRTVIRPASPVPVGGPIAVRWLEERASAWESLKLASERRKDLNTRLLNAVVEAEESSREADIAGQRLAGLLREAGAENGEELLRRSALVLRRKELERSLREWEMAMFGGKDEEARSRIMELLASRDAISLEEEKAQLEQSHTELEQEKSALLQTRGRLLQERESLEKEGREDAALQRLAEQRAALRGIAEQYAVSALSAALISRTRRIYEREKQPQVLALASSYFGRLTGGEYRRIVMTLGSKELKVEHREAGVLDIGLLSRGTAEQLYLSLRLALAVTMDRHHPLPLLLDDLFVNFDERRMQAALSLLGDLSRHRQIVMMTCHRHIAEESARRVPGCSVISV